MHFAPSSCRNLPSTSSMVHLLHRLYGVDAADCIFHDEETGYWALAAQPVSVYKTQPASGLCNRYVNSNLSTDTIMSSEFPRAVPATGAPNSVI